MVIEEVRQGCTSRGFAGKALGFLDFASASQQLRPHAPPADVLVGDAWRRISFGEFRQPQSLLVVASLGEECVGELRRERGEVTPVPISSSASHAGRSARSAAAASPESDAM
jgi:hypothetical protein